MFSNDSCLNITVFVILALFAYILYVNYYENFQVESFAEKHHHHSHTHNKHHSHHKHHAHHESHPSEKKSEEETIKTESEIHLQAISEDLKVNNLVSKSGLTSRGIFPIIMGDEKSNEFLMHTPQDGRKQLWITPRKGDNTDWDWSYSLTMDHANNTISTNANTFIVNGGVHTRGNMPVLLGDDANNQFVLHTPQDGRRALYLAPRKLDNSDWDWGSALSMDYKNHTISTNGNYFVAQSGMASQGCDFVLGQNCGRGDSGPSRALVKDQGPQLVINYANDFKAGTRIDGDLYLFGKKVGVQGNNLVLQ